LLQDFYDVPAVAEKKGYCFAMIDKTGKTAVSPVFCVVFTGRTNNDRREQGF
jgi:hypothetical protein